MDLLDRLSIVAIACLIASAIVVSFFQHSNSPGDEEPRAVSRNPVTRPHCSEIKTRESKIRSLIENQSLDQAQRLVMKLIRQYPDNGEPHLLLGDIYLRKQDVIKALYKYRDAVDRNPDYLDKNTPLFQGKKLQNVVSEGLSELEKRAKRGNDAELGKDRRLIYYLQRRIAGACG